jgi:beta-glucosidase
MTHHGAEVWALLIGTYTRGADGSPTRSHGIYSATVSTSTVSAVRSVASIENPSWLTSTEDGRLVYDPPTHHLFVPELGMDAILVYALDDTGRLRPVPHARITTQPGAGPRHLTFHPDGIHLLVLNELSNAVTLHGRNDSGSFSVRSEVSTLPSGFVGENTASALRLSADGTRVLASNRRARQHRCHRVQRRLGQPTARSGEPIAWEDPSRLRAGARRSHRRCRSPTQQRHHHLLLRSRRRRNERDRHSVGGVSCLSPTGLSSLPSSRIHSSSRIHLKDLLMTATSPTSPASAGRLFPRGFIIGAATAAYQIEGAHMADERGPSIWDTFSHTPGLVVGGDTGDIADDHYNRLDDDLDLMASLGLQAYRFSIAWPRIQPLGTGAPNTAGIDFYSRLVDGLRTRNIQPIATLYHWDLPQALQNKGGWTNRDTAKHFAEYAAIIGRALGDRVAQWTTLNEPWCSAFLGYGSAAHAPGIADDLSALQAVHHLNLAHGLGLDALRSTVLDPDANHSITLNFHGLTSVDATSGEAMERIDALAHRSFLDPMLNGRLSDRLVSDTREITDWSFVHDGDLTQINRPIDVLGVNYYYSTGVRMWDGVSPRRTSDGHRNTAGTPWPGSRDVEFVPAEGETTSMGWNIDPDGLERLLISLSREFPSLPLMITENGAAFDDVEEDGRVHDIARVDYLQRHFAAAARAIDQGVSLRGYLVWSLFDNFEWAWGYSKRFGIVRVDYENQRRIVKDSGMWLRSVIHEHVAR